MMREKLGGQVGGCEGKVPTLQNKVDGLSILIKMGLLICQEDLVS